MPTESLRVCGGKRIKYALVHEKMNGSHSYIYCEKRGSSSKNLTSLFHCLPTQLESGVKATTIAWRPLCPEEIQRRGLNCPLNQNEELSKQSEYYDVFSRDEWTNNWIYFSLLKTKNELISAFESYLISLSSFSSLIFLFLYVPSVSDKVNVDSFYILTIRNQFAAELLTFKRKGGSGGSLKADIKNGGKCNKVEKNLQIFSTSLKLIPCHRRRLELPTLLRLAQPQFLVNLAINLCCQQTGYFSRLKLISHLIHDFSKFWKKTKYAENRDELKHRENSLIKGTKECFFNSILHAIPFIKYLAIFFPFSETTPKMLKPFVKFFHSPFNVIPSAIDDDVLGAEE
ncbi:hypothetical protein EGR_03876 [Echinococcus granulosus]|uniref:Uncharacterized protein n=1 Tax=Echinococcus granulosus TaxID=6210 RepID=W6UJ73_ECHGR|nr:hypothetical protein EGR_03876 [Echinococcus granulosus]EUB61201.1 hypothetical protein EGR_03876 [Echinococcus granulosus]